MSSTASSRTRPRARPRAPKVFPTRSSTRASPLGQLSKHRVIVLVGLDDRLRVRRLQRLLQQTDLASHARHELVEHLHVVDGFLDNFLVCCGTIEAPLPM